MENTTPFPQQSPVTPKASLWALPPAQPTHSSLIHLAPCEPNSAYYRSKIITAHNGINPLIAAASALFVALIQLRHQTVDIHLLYQELVHEIKSFETRAQIAGYRTETILIARYLLCATLDELLLYGKYRLLSYFHNEDGGDERFFIIIERLCHEPGAHLDLLELAYLCLSQGFTGKYRHGENGRAELTKFTEQLYRCIHQQHIPSYQEKNFPTHLTKEDRRSPLWPIITCTGLLLLIIYTGFTFMLESTAASLYPQLNNISKQYAEG